MKLGIRFVANLIAKPINAKTNNIMENFAIELINSKPRHTIYIIDTYVIMWIEKTTDRI